MAELSHHLTRLLYPMLRKKGWYYGKLLESWHEVVGEDIAKQCLPLKFSKEYERQQEKKILHVQVNSSAMALQLPYLEPVIIERITGFFGFQMVDRLVAVHIPSQVAPPPLPAAKPIPMIKAEILDEYVEGIEDTELARALHQLGSALQKPTH
jgi:hypothetical protein